MTDPVERSRTRCGCGSFAPGIGFVPLGMVAGYDDSSGALYDGVVAQDDSTGDGVVAFDHAPAHCLEGTPAPTWVATTQSAGRFKSQAKRPSCNSRSRDKVRAPRAPYAHNRHRPRRSLAGTRVAAYSENPSTNAERGARPWARGDNDSFGVADDAPTAAAARASSSARSLSMARASSVGEPHHRRKVSRKVAGDGFAVGQRATRGPAGASRLVPRRRSV